MIGPPDLTKPVPRLKNGSCAYCNAAHYSVVKARKIGNKVMESKLEGYRQTCLSSHGDRSEHGKLFSKEQVPPPPGWKCRQCGGTPPPGRWFCSLECKRAFADPVCDKIIQALEVAR